jgi:hypothetical protein
MESAKPLEAKEQEIKTMLFNSITQMMDRYDEDEEPIELPPFGEGNKQQTIINMSFKNSLNQSNNERYSLANRYKIHKAKSSIFIDDQLNR